MEPTVNPCKDCIVRAMCVNLCVLLKDYVNNHLPKDYALVYPHSYEYLKSLLLESQSSPSHTYFSTYTMAMNLGGERRYPKLAVKNGEIINEAKLV